MIKFVTIHDPDEAFELLSKTRWVFPLNGYYVDTFDKRLRRRVAGVWHMFAQGTYVKIAYPAKADCGFWIGDAMNIIEPRRVEQTFWPIMMYVSDEEPDWFMMYVFPWWAVVKSWLVEKPKLRRDLHNQTVTKIR